MSKTNENEAAQDAAGDAAAEGAATALDQGAPSTVADHLAVIAELTTERDGLQVDLAELGNDLAVRDTKIERLEAEIEKLKGKVKAAPAVRKPGKLRDFSKLLHPGAIDDADARTAARKELADLIAVADDVTIVFTDGGKEIGALAPVRVTGNPWVMGSQSLALALPIDLVGLADAAISIDGYALLLDDEPLAYRPRFEALAIPAGQETRLVGEIAF